MKSGFNDLLILQNRGCLKSPIFVCFSHIEMERVN